MNKVGKGSMFICRECGATSLRWLGRCPSCGEWDSMVEEPAGRPAGEDFFEPKIVSIDSAESSVTPRIKTGNREFDRVLGNGIVSGSLVLLGGEPGVGKSTLLLQVAELLASKGSKVLYISGEESPEQIKMRGERLGIASPNLLLSTETRIDLVAEMAARQQPVLLIVDSIQTMFNPAMTSVPGSVGQIRECTMHFLKIAKKLNLPIILIGHITKDGSIAGPKLLEHIVDAVLYFEGDTRRNQKLVRTVKNRFGPSYELGVFEMTSTGLRSVDNPSGVFLAERKQHVSGSVVLAAMQGTRPMLVELQALVTRSSFSTARRMTVGIDPNRVALLMAMLEKRTGIILNSCDVYMNVAGGLVLAEPALDLAIIAAVVSSFRDIPIASDTVVFGEVGLAGEIRSVSSADSRIRESMGMGFKQVIMPAVNLESIPEEPRGKMLGVETVLDFLDLAGL